MDAQSKTPQAVETRSPVNRTKWRWRILAIKVWLVAAFLLICLLGLGVTAVLSGADEGLELEQRIYAVGAGLLIIVVGMSILKAAIPLSALTALFQKKFK